LALFIRVFQGVSHWIETSGVVVYLENVVVPTTAFVVLIEELSDVSETVTPAVPFAGAFVSVFIPHPREPVESTLNIHTSPLRASPASLAPNSFISLLLTKATALMRNGPHG